MARPKLGENKKTNRVGVFYTDKEFAEVSEKAASAGLEPAEFLRQLSLGHKVEGRAVVPEVNKVAAQNINDGLTILNQAMRLIHDGRAEKLPQDLLEVLREEMKQTREMLLGRKWQ